MAENPVLSTLNNGVRLIKLNRPKVLNAINPDMYLKVTNILNEDAKNDAVVVTLITGIGNYYSSGTDFSKKSENDTPKKQRYEITKNFVLAFVNYPKLLIAIVNGPAYGIAVTTLGLCDIVYASDRAVFVTPFVNLGLTPEGGSSYTFQRILGRSRASEMLFLGKKITAQEAADSGFVAKVIPHENLEDFIKDLHKFGQLPINTIKNAKYLLNAPIKNKLHEMVDLEMEILKIMFESPEFLKIRDLILKKQSKL